MEEEDGYLDRTEEERREIIAKYDRGREPGAQIDDWEDPQLPLYHSTDRYGFIHEHGLSTPSSKRDEKKKFEETEKELERSTKWLKMKDKWDKVKDKQSEKLKERVYKGIPNRVRAPIWALLLELPKIKQTQKGKYEEMLELARKYSPDIRQIDLDVNRTYRDTMMFRERFGTAQKSLFNILSAYSVYNSEIGYCQGMSQIAALLLMYLVEEDAFWGLAQLMTNDKYGMHGFFIAGFPKLVRFQAHHDRVLRKMLPRLKKHFDKHGVDSGLYTLKWFFQCFLDRVPFELSLRLWDIFLLEGDRVLICGAYTILKSHSRQLLNRKSMDEIIHYIQSKIPENFGMDCDKAIENYRLYSDELARKRLDHPGPPKDEELPKKPFGVIDRTPKPISKSNMVKPKSSSPRGASVSPSLPIPKNDIPTGDTLTVHTTNNMGSKSVPLHEPNNSDIPRSRSGSASPFGKTYSIPSGDPRASSPTSSKDNYSDDIPLDLRVSPVTPVNFPNDIPIGEAYSMLTNNEVPSGGAGETLRIHVPYNSSGQQSSSNRTINYSSTSSASTHTQSHSQSTTSNRFIQSYNMNSNSPSPTSVSSRNGYDLSKSDPNRIKINVSST